MRKTSKNIKEKAGLMGGALLRYDGRSVSPVCPDHVCDLFQAQRKL